MAIPMKMRASTDAIKVLITHPSENGLRKVNGQLVPALFIKNIKLAVNGKVVADGQWGGGMAKDPYLNIKVQGMKAGDKVTVNVVDSNGDTGNSEATVG
ncbi:MAG TPA: thiosulfate oxidation carrier complex protein SoxZ [Thiobacillaceae bacterium]|nr:thiosulfate oxidation carrier complex protein SoxZ [Thiobacillaceae bacterium]